VQPLVRAKKVANTVDRIRRLRCTHRLDDA
jgi:hypothetical protein